MGIATIFMAAQDGTLSKNSGQTAQKILANYVPVDVDENDVDSSEDDDGIDSLDETDEKTVQKVKRRFLSVAYGKAMFNNDIIKSLVEAGITPKKEHFKPFMKDHPLPQGFTWQFLQQKCKTKVKQNKKRKGKKSEEKTPKKVENCKKDNKGRAKNTKK